MSANRFSDLMEDDEDDDREDDDTPEQPQVEAPVQIKPMRQWTLEERLAHDVAKADAELARRLEEREKLAPFVEAIASLLCSLESMEQFTTSSSSTLSPASMAANKPPTRSESNSRGTLRAMITVTRTSGTSPSV